MLTILIVEGNTPETNNAILATEGRLQSQAFQDLLNNEPGVRTKILFAADTGVPLPSMPQLRTYDGVLWTGSALSLTRSDPAADRQVDLARRALQAGAFCYGSCWGLQVAVAACGGHVYPNPKGREIGVARAITLTSDGHGHPFLRGRSAPFDALAVHRDIVDPLPSSMMTVLASSPMSAIQAAEIHLGSGRFWAVQYHPEYTFRDVASAFRRYAQLLVAEDLFGNLDKVRAVADLYSVAEKPDLDRGGRAMARLGIRQELADPDYRTLEIRNWVDALRTSPR